MIGPEVILMGLIYDLPTPPPEKKGWPWTEETDPELYSLEIKWPRLSIVTPSYNQGEFIEETIRSILLQNYPNLEYVIIDGGSTDHTKSIIEKYGKWIDFWVSEKDDGQADALNKGFQKTTGEICGYLNSDDLLLPESLFEVAKKFQAQGSEKIVISGKLEVFPGDGEIIPEENWEIKDWIRLDNFSLPQPSSFWSSHRGITSFRTDYQYVFDRIFFMSLMEEGFKLVLSDQTLAAFRIHEKSKTNSYLKSFFTENDKFNKAKAKEVGLFFYFSYIRRKSFEVRKEQFIKTKKLTSRNFRDIMTFPVIHPKILLTKWFWGWSKYIFANSIRRSRTTL